MSKKDYELIAQTLADVWCDYEALETIARALAEAFAKQNEQFNRSKFLEACGLEVTK